MPVAPFAPGYRRRVGSGRDGRAEGVVHHRAGRKREGPDLGEEPRPGSNCLPRRCSWPPPRHSLVERARAGAARSSATPNSLKLRPIPRSSIFWLVAPNTDETHGRRAGARGNVAASGDGLPGGCSSAHFATAGVGKIVPRMESSPRGRRCRPGWCRSSRASTRSWSRQGRTRPSACHWSACAPVAVTLDFTLVPALTDCNCGWVVMPGAPRWRDGVDAEGHAFQWATWAMKPENTTSSHRLKCGTGWSTLATGPRILVQSTGPTAVRSVANPAATTMARSPRKASSRWPCYRSYSGSNKVLA